MVSVTITAWVLVELLAVVAVAAKVANDELIDLDEEIANNELEALVANEADVAVAALPSKLFTVKVFVLGT